MADQGIERLRLFVAVEVPEAIKAQIAASQARLRESVKRATIKWTSREQFHITLQFLGHLEGGMLPDLARELETACQPVFPFELQAKGVGFFPNERRPRVVWIGTRDSGGHLSTLARAVQARTLPFTGEPEEERDFSGHITLGRIKEIRRPEVESLARTATDLAQANFGSWTVGEVRLMRSRLSPHGPVYTSEKSFKLAHRPGGKV